MKTVELAYLSIDGTHFLMTPNLVVGSVASVATDHNGKKFNILTASKTWVNCVEQAKAQLSFFMGCTWATSQEIQQCHGAIDNQDLAILQTQSPVALTQLHA